MKNCILLLIIVGFFSCEEEGKGSNMQGVIPMISIDDNFAAEKDANFDLELTISISEISDKSISVDYTTVSKTASAGKDFEMVTGTTEIKAGALTTSISVPILKDDEKELQEYFEVSLSNPVNATLGDSKAMIILRDNDVVQNTSEGGYLTNDTQDGYDLVWSDEFDGDRLDESSWTYETGNGCDRNLCGWGNSELQTYSSDEKNISVKDGALTITALAESGGGYSSARIVTMDKREFRFGRIDIRAKLPSGQGLWPALWMLGANIGDVGWPRCGELDIMEHKGHQLSTVSGAAHWGNAGESSTIKGNSTNIRGEFRDGFHVFTILWTTNSVKWYVDETTFLEVTVDDVNNTPYPFNSDFFFIMNVAVGGNFPGDPDETTVFPQSMEVDYIRVFQEK